MNPKLAELIMVLAEEASQLVTDVQTEIEDVKSGKSTSTDAHDALKILTDLGTAVIKGLASRA